MTLKTEVSNRCRKFKKDGRGSVAITTAIGIVVLIGAAGAAVDYGSAMAYRAEMQAAADAAALAAGTSDKKSDDRLKTLSDEYFFSNLTKRSNLEVTNTVVETDADRLSYSAWAKMDTTLLSLLGIKKLDIAVQAEVKRASEDLEVVVVLDTTRSMLYGSSWQQAQQAMVDMLNTMADASYTKDGANFQVTLVPMNDRVNVGKDKASWASGGVSGYWSGCFAPREEKVGSWDYQLTDKPPSQLPFLPSTKEHDNVYSNTSYYRTKTANWVDNGENDNPHDDGIPFCPDEIVGPTSEVDDIRRQLATLTIRGTGRLDEGMAWAWRLLSPKWEGLWGPRDYPGQPEDKKKIVIFVSDGLTETYRHEVGGNGVSVERPNRLWGFNEGSKWGFKNMVRVCRQMKRRGIEIHMLKINGNPHVRKFFKSCASAEDKFYEVENADQLMETLRLIGRKVTKLHLSG